MRVNKLIRFLSLIAIISIISGCAGMDSYRSRRDESDREFRTSKKGLTEDPRDVQQIAENLKFEDIPVPVGFYLDMKDSFVFQNDYIRVGIVNYLGKGDVNKVTDFFKKQMPLFNWELINSIEYFKSILTFIKDTQSCVVIIEPIGGKVVITVASGPREQEA